MDRKTITGTSSIDVWNQVYNDLSQETLASNYYAAIEYDNKKIRLDIVRSIGGALGGGGFDSTTLSAPIPKTPFSFSVQPEDFVHKIGKIFGEQDIVVGYKDFDEEVIIKSNEERRVREILQDEEVRAVLKGLSGFSLSTSTDDESGEKYLELYIQRAVLDMNELQLLFSVFTKVLDKLPA